MDGGTRSPLVVPDNVTRSLQIAGLTMERPQTAPRQQRRAKQRAAETPVERDARLRKERLKRALKRSEETPVAREARLVEERLKRARKRAEETPAARAERLEKDRVRRARARAGRGEAVEAGAVVSDAVQELGARALGCINFCAEEIAFMGSSQRYTSDPRLALAYYYCCSVDPAGFVFGDEQLNGDEGNVPRERLEGVFDDYPRPDDLSACQGLSSESESESTDIWACASCGRMLLQNKNGDKVVFCALREMQRFVLDDAERVRLFAGCSEACVRKYRQVYFAGCEVYYLIPELVRDVESIPLCETCRGDPRKSAFSVASGHDYGRVGELPELTQIALDCIAPARCFGMDISFTGKHSSGHTICFPSDGPSKVASVLPRVEPDCMPRVTFIGPEEEWRIQKRKFRGLYSIPVDSVYEWLGALSQVNNVFREEQIRIDSSGRRRRQLVDLVNAIDDGVHVTDSGDVNAVCDLATSERFGSDIHVYRGNIGAQEDQSSELSQDVVVQQSAVLPGHTECPTVAHGIVDALLDAIPPQTQPIVDASPPVVPIKRGCSPMVEWHENAKMLAGVFPNLFLTGPGPLPSGPLPQALVDHFLHYWDGRFENQHGF